MNVIRAGCTLHLRDSGSSHPHLWAVLTDPTGDPPWVLMVMLTTHRWHTDDTVVLVPGDHPFIKHDTSIHYSTCEIRTIPKILKAMKDGRCHLRESLDRAILRRAQQGFLDSPRTVNALREKCQDLLSSD